MRRKDREVVETKQLEEIINKCKIMHLGMIDRDTPYVLPINFSYEMKEDMFHFYFHSAKQGRKVDVLKQNPKVCITISYEQSLIEAEKPCEYSYTYASVIAEGIVKEIENLQQKKEILTNFMKYQTNKIFTFNDQEANYVAVYEVVVSHISGKAHLK